MYDYGDDYEDDYENVEESNVMYHYCSLDTFIKILESKKIRLGNPCKMNDNQELLWYFNFIPEETEKFISIVDDEGIKSKNIYIIKDKLLEVFNEWFYNRTVPYIASFSEDGDILSQWRAYADDGKGVAIGFKFYDFNAKAGSALSFKSICYDELKQRDKIFNVIKSLIENNSLEFRGTKNYSDFLFDNVSVLLEEAVVSKNPAFVEEREVRLIYYPEYDFYDSNLEKKQFNIQGPSFRSIGDDITSYYELDFSDMKNIIIDSVYIGPKCKSTKHDIEMILKNMSCINNIRNITIKKSMASYR